MNRLFNPRPRSEYIEAAADNKEEKKMFEHLEKALEADTAEKINTRTFYIENGFCPSWAVEHRQNPDRGLEEYSTPAKWEAYKAGTLSREKAVEIAVKRGTREIMKQHEKQLEKLRTAAAAPDLVEISIDVQWAKNRTWGANPTADIRTVDGWFSGHASGCGYDKQSAAVAAALNQSPAVRKVLYTAAEKALASGEAFKRLSSGVVSWGDVLGYGSGYAVLPYFEGGVGVSCFWSIFKDCGFSVRSVASGRMYDVYMVERKAG